MIKKNMKKMSKERTAPENFNWMRYLAKFDSVLTMDTCWIKDQSEMWMKTLWHSTSYKYSYDKLMI